MEIITTNALISINATFVAQLVSFLIFVAVFNRVMVRPLQSIAEKRKNQFRAILEDIVRAEKTLERFQTELEDKKEGIRLESLAIAAELEKAGASMAEEIAAEARLAADKVKCKVEHKIAAQIVEARKGMKREAEALTALVVEKILEGRGA